MKRANWGRAKAHLSKLVQDAAYPAGWAPIDSVRPKEARGIMRGLVILLVGASIGSLTGCDGVGASAPNSLSQTMALSSQVGRESNVARSMDVSSDPTIPAAVFFSVEGEGIYAFNPRLQRKTGPLPGSGKHTAALATDANGNLYALESDSQMVVMYAPPYTDNPGTLFHCAKTQYCEGMAVSTKGIVATLTQGPENQYDQLPPGNVNFYAPGDHVPCATVTNDSYYSQGVYAAAFETNGRLLVVGQGARDPDLTEIGNGCKATRAIHVTANIDINSYSPEIAIDADGNVAVLGDVCGNPCNEEDETEEINVYSPPVNYKLGSQIMSVSLSDDGSVGYPYLGFPFAFSTKGTDVYVSSNNGYAYANAYAAGGTPIYSVRLKQASAIAVTPVEVP